MTSINNSAAAMLSYYGSQVSAQQSTAAKPTGSESQGQSQTQTGSDPLANLQRLARQMMARSEGGLLRAMAGSNPAQASSNLQYTAQGNAASAGIQLPDVSRLDRDEAAKLLEQVQKLVDADVEKSVSFTGVNGDKQTDSLETYRQWLQAKGGISVYA
jgi:hypothetical protein